MIKGFLLSVPSGIHPLHSLPSEFFIGDGAEERANKRKEYWETKNNGCHYSVVPVPVNDGVSSDPVQERVNEGKKNNPPCRNEGCNGFLEGPFSPFFPANWDTVMRCFVCQSDFDRKVVDNRGRSGFHQEDGSIVWQNGNGYTDGYSDWQTEDLKMRLEEFGQTLE